MCFKAILESKKSMSVSFHLNVVFNWLETVELRVKRSWMSRVQVQARI